MPDEPPTTPDPASPAAPRPDATPDRVVVGVDGSAASRQALRWAAFLAGAAAAGVHAVGAWAPYTVYGQVGAGWTVMPADWNPAADARRVVDDTVHEVFGDDPPAGLQITVQEGNAARVLIDVSRDARMLVVGSRGHGGFAGLLLGSVSAACAEHASCPVMVVHGTALPPPG